MKPNKQKNHVTSTIAAQDTLHAAEQVLGSSHPEVAMARNNLAVMYYAEGKYAEAEKLLEDVVLFWEQAHNTHHPKKRS